MAVSFPNPFQGKQWGVGADYSHTPDPIRTRKIQAKQSAIQRRLDKTNDSNKKSAQDRLKKPGGNPFLESYTTKSISNAKNSDYTTSDFGVDKGAAIPWTELTKKTYVKKSGQGPINMTPDKPKPGKPTFTVPKPGREINR